MKLLIVDDEYIAVEGVMNGVNWDALGFEQVFQAYSHAVGGQALHEVGVFFFGHTGLDDVGAVGRVVAFGQ